MDDKNAKSTAKQTSRLERSPHFSTKIRRMKQVIAQDG